MQVGIVASSIRPILASDSFNKANQNLHGTTGFSLQVGGTPYLWTVAFGAATSSWTIDANRAKRNITGARYVAMPVNHSDVIVHAKLVQMPNAGDFISLLARFSEVPFNAIRIRLASNGVTLMQKIANGVTSNLGGGTGVTVALNDKVSLLCRGSLLEAWKNDTTLLWRTNDSDVLGAGSAGFHCQGSNGTDGAFDDFVVEAA